MSEPIDSVLARALFVLGGVDRATAARNASLIMGLLAQQGVSLVRLDDDAEFGPAWAFVEMTGDWLATADAGDDDPTRPQVGHESPGHSSEAV